MLFKHQGWLPSSIVARVVIIIMADSNPFCGLLKTLPVNGGQYQYYSLPDLKDSRYEFLPYCIRVVLESTVRNCDNVQIQTKDVENILNWQENRSVGVEIPFIPARVLLQDFTGVPAVVDFAAMRDAVKHLGGDPEKINPVCPVDLVIDHSVQVDFARSSESFLKNQQLEYERNKERFLFLKWGANAFKNMLIVPPGSGIVHQVNLEYLARVVFNVDGLLYPDTLVGTDSHTTMINGLGVVGWGVGGIEAEAVMLGQVISMVLPEVVGYYIHGDLDQLTTATDIVLTITKHLREIGVVGKFVEFFGPGISQLSIPDRSTISNMCPEYGATVGYFPVDVNTLEYLRQTGRNADNISLVGEYLRANKLIRDLDNPDQDPVYSEIVRLDLSTVVPCCAGPKRPNDLVSLSNMKADFTQSLKNKIGFKGYAVAPEKQTLVVPFLFDDVEHTLTHGSIVIAAITSCTNTSNPSVMLGAGMLAKKAVEAGLTVKPYIKTSLSPGSGVVTYYLKESGVNQYLEKLGFIEAPSNKIAVNTRGLTNVLTDQICGQTSEVQDAYVLMNLGNSVPSDHISPAGNIARNSPAARYLASKGLTPREFNSYGSRRGNDEVMAHGTFANIRLVNKFMKKAGGRTIYLPTGEEMDVYDAAIRYRSEGKQVLLLAGKSYGSGASRDWAAKGPYLLGVRVVIAESYERIHRSNLVGMGILPLQYRDGETAESLKVTGKETFSIDIPQDIQVGQLLEVKLSDGRTFQVKTRLDTQVEKTYFINGGVLNYMVRKML